MTRATELWLAESPLDVVEGESLTFSVVWTGKTSGATPETKVYKNGSDVTAVVCSGADAISSGTPPVQTLKTISNLVGGEEYVVVVRATVDGNTERHKLLLRVAKPGATQ